MLPRIFGVVKPCALIGQELGQASHKQTRAPEAHCVLQGRANTGANAPGGVFLRVTPVCQARPPYRQ